MGTQLKRTVEMTYPDENHPCIIKHCQRKKRNGRCPLNRITFGYRTDSGTDYSDCRNFLLQAAIVAEEPIHDFFELSYASYLVLPRSALQSMPVKWQRLFVALLNQMHEAFGDIPEHGTYHVDLKDDNGRFVHDPLQDYGRGRRRLSPTNATTKKPEVKP